MSGEEIKGHDVILGDLWRRTANELSHQSRHIQVGGHGEEQGDQVKTGEVQVGVFIVYL